jgi:hypothetical protein
MAANHFAKEPWRTPSPLAFMSPPIKSIEDTNNNRQMI